MNLLVTESQDDLFILFFEQLIQQLQLKNEISIPYIPKEIIINICSHMNSKNNDFKHNDVCCNRCSPIKFKNNDFKRNDFNYNISVDAYVTPQMIMSYIPNDYSLYYCANYYYWIVMTDEIIKSIGMYYGRAGKLQSSPVVVY
jgi:hypothetical protein